MSGAGTQKVSKMGPRPRGVTAVSQAEVSSWEHRDLESEMNVHLGVRKAAWTVSFIEQMKEWPTSDSRVVYQGLAGWPCTIFRVCVSSRTIWAQQKPLQDSL